MNEHEFVDNIISLITVLILMIAGIWIVCIYASWQVAVGVWLIAAGIGAANNNGKFK